MKISKKILAAVLAVVLFCACIPFSFAVEDDTAEICTHEYSFWKVEREATDDHDGAMVKYCADCGKALGSKAFGYHTHEAGYEVTLIPAFCETNGEAGVVCGICDAVYETKVIPALGHSGSTSTTVTGGSLEVVLLIDESSSMWSSDPNEIRKDVSAELVDRIGTNDKAAVVGFGSSSRVITYFTSDKDLLKSGINEVNDFGSSTHMYDGINTSFELFDETSSTQKYIVLLTDGVAHDSSSDYADIAAEKGVTIHTVGLGSGVNEYELQEIATATGGKYFFASVADDLFDIYEEITETIISGGGTWVTTITPTCHSAGERVLFCSRCGKAVASEVIEATAHHYSAAVYNTPETHTGTCVDCGNIINDFHTWTDWEYNEDNTFFKKGTQSRYCTGCLKVETVEVSHSSVICRIFWPVINLFVRFFNMIIPLPAN